MSKSCYKKILSIISAFLILNQCTAYAQRPPGEISPAGSTAASGTQIDRSLYTDGSQYENTPVSTDSVRVALSCGDSADPEAELVNLSGGGFLIGSFDSSRSFEKLSRTDCCHIKAKISCSAGRWRILLGVGCTDKNDSSETGKMPPADTLEIDGQTRLLIGSFDSMSEADREIKDKGLEGEAFYDGSGSILLYSADSGKLIYSTEPGNSSLAVVPDGDDPVTEYGKNHYRGSFEFRMHDASHLNVINYVGIEDYVKGVIPYEMSCSWPPEALKAQAVCARTYAVYNQNRFSRYGCDLTADTYSQVYRGTLEADSVSDAAVDDTAGELVRYKGQVCEVYYCSSNGGATEDGINVFDTPAPYLSGKTDPFEDALDYPLKFWEKTMSRETILDCLHEKNYEISDIERIEAVYSDTGNVIAMKYYNKSGTCLEIRGRSCYTSLGLKSCRFTVEEKDGKYVFSGRGWGHSCGMSQWGARAMASVYGYNYEDIIRFYFSGAYIA